MRDDFSEDVKRSIANRVGNICSNPDCHALTSGPQDDPSKALNVGVAAHITSAALGGPRYNAALTGEERRSAENAIWLCQNCAKLVDNDVSQFTEKILQAWKTVNEYQARGAIGKSRSPVPESEAQRKAREILKSKGQRIMLVQMNTGKAVHVLGIRGCSAAVQLLDCSEFFVKVVGNGWSQSRSIPMTNIEIGFDDKQGCLELQERNS
ncbi:MAG: hypothetical protein WBW53_13625 [Terriglobales bacterium]